MTDTRGILPGSFQSVLRSYDLRMLWLSTVSNQIGVGMQQVLLGWLVLEMTNSSGMVGVVFAMRSAPNLVVGFAAGSVTDRLDRRTVMRVTVIGMICTSLIIALLLFTHQLTVWQLLLFSFIQGMLQAFHMVARQVYVYDLVGAGSSVQGISLIAFAQRVGEMLGALLAGLVLHWWGEGVSFLVMSGGYVLGVCLLYTLRQQGIAAPVFREPIRQNMWNYWQALWTNRLMQSLMISTSAAEILGFSHQVLLPILAREVLQTDAAGLGVLMAFRSVGNGLGVLALTMVGGIRRQGRVLLAVIVLFGVGQILLSQATAFWMAMLVVTLINIMASATDILHHTLLQRSVSNEQRGRAMGSWIVGTGTAPAGHLEIGYLAGLTSAPSALLINGVALVALAAMLAIFLPRLRHL